MLVAALAAACGEKKEEKAKEPKPAEAKPDPAEVQRREEEARQKRLARIEELKGRERELKGLVAEKKQALDEMIARHEKEEAELPDPSKFRRRVQQLIRDSNVATSTYHSMRTRWEELKKIAESKAGAELKALRAEKEAIDKRYDQALSDMRQAAMEASYGVVEDSPVKRELDTIRAVKKRWFEATPGARRGTADSGERSTISAGFRRWLGEDPIRETVVTKVLAQPEAGAGKALASYDFTDLEFYVLLELLEDILDKQNIAVENKRLAGEEQKLIAIEQEVDAVREKIAQKMMEGGSELAEFEDLDSRMDDAKTKAEGLQQQLANWRAYLAEISGTRTVHLEEQEAARKELEAAQKDLKEVQTELKRLGA